MTQEEIIRAADILVHRRGARHTDLPRLTAAIQAADDVAANANIEIGSAFAKLTNGDAPWNLYFFPYSGNKTDSTWQHIAHAAIHGIVMTGRIDMDNDAIVSRINRLISTCHSAEGLTRRITEVVGMIGGPPEKTYAIAPPKKTASEILNQLRGPHA